ncbi:MAG: hypothetical protein ACPLF9_08865, partial [Methanothermobacter tenebrarum]
KATPSPWHVVVIGYRPDGEAYRISCTADVEWDLTMPVAKLGTVYDAERDEYVNIEVGRKLEDGLLIDARADAEFIAAAREALPYWLTRARDLEAENARLREVIQFVLDDSDNSAFEQFCETTCANALEREFWERYGKRYGCIDCNADGFFGWLQRRIREALGEGVKQNGRA